MNSPHIPELLINIYALKQKRGCLKSPNHCHIELCRNITMIGKQICMHFDKLNVTNLFAFETASF
jgi:hypothetical protein